MNRKEQLTQIENLKKMIEQSENALQRVRSTLDELEQRLLAGEVIDLSGTEMAISHAIKPGARTTSATRRDTPEPFSPALLADTALAGS